MATFGRIMTIAIAVTSAGCAASETPISPHRVEINVAPLQLPGIDFACYDILVQNQDMDPVIRRGNPAANLLSPTSPDTDTLCSTRFGNGPGGDISYVAPCDAQRPNHTVTVWVDGLYTGTPASPVAVVHQDPCPTGCALPVVCAENADTPVTFNLTVMRPANQGFFDVAVNFRDIFCSAKVDCTSDGVPIELLHHPVSKAREQTLVLGFACTAGAGDAEDTVLFRDPIVIDCGGVITTLDPTIPEGNAWSPSNPDPNTNDAVWQYASYFGEEALSCGNGSCNKRFWNVAVGFDPGVANCTVTTRMTAASALDMPDFTTPENATYPWIDVNVPLTGAGGGLLCSEHPLNGEPTGTRTRYTEINAPLAFCHRFGQGFETGDASHCITDEVPIVTGTMSLFIPGDPTVADVDAEIVGGQHSDQDFTDEEGRYELFGPNREYMLAFEKTMTVPGWQDPTTGGPGTLLYTRRQLVDATDGPIVVNGVVYPGVQIAAAAPGDEAELASDLGGGGPSVLVYGGAVSEWPPEASCEGCWTFRETLKRFTGQDIFGSLLDSNVGYHRLSADGNTLVYLKPPVAPSTTPTVMTASAPAWQPEVVGAADKIIAWWLASHGPDMITWRAESPTSATPWHHHDLSVAIRDQQTGLWNRQTIAQNVVSYNAAPDLGRVYYTTSEDAPSWDVPSKVWAAQWDGNQWTHELVADSAGFTVFSAAGGGTVVFVKKTIMAWASTGRVAVATRNNGVWDVVFVTGEHLDLEVLDGLDPSGSYVWTQIYVPPGHPGDWGEAVWALVPLAGGPIKYLGFHGDFSFDGRGYAVINPWTNKLYAATADGDWAMIEVASGVSLYLGADESVYNASEVSRNGAAIAYLTAWDDDEQTGTFSIAREVDNWVPRQISANVHPGWQGIQGGCVFSEDNGTVMFNKVSPEAVTGTDLYVARADRNWLPTRIASDVYVGTARISADGSTIVYPAPDTDPLWSGVLMMASAYESDRNWPLLPDFGNVLRWDDEGLVVKGVDNPAPNDFQSGVYRIELPKPVTP